MKKNRKQDNYFYIIYWKRKEPKLTIRKASKAKTNKERSPVKVKKVLKAKGYDEGKLPKGKELHHVKSVSEGGKTTPKNTKVISKTEHKNIHKNRRKVGKI